MNDLYALYTFLQSGQALCFSSLPKIRAKLAAGYDEARIIEAYPGLVREDIQAVLWYAEQRMRYEEVHLLAPAETLA